MVSLKTENRLKIEGLSDAILGALAFLNETHVHNPHKCKIHHRNFVARRTGTKKFSSVIFARTRSFFGRYFIPERHIKGAWPGFINYLPDNFKSPAGALLMVTDYNLFTSVSTAYPLFLLDDSNLPNDHQIVNKMLHSTYSLVNKSKRGRAYNFWLVKTYRNGFSSVGPVNLPVSLISFRWYLNKVTGLFGLEKFRDSDSLFGWVASCFNKTENPGGSSALVNIPDDSDNTSNALIFQTLFGKRFGSDKVDQDAVEVICKFRDVNRKKDERWNKMLPDETGAFLTWLKDERNPGFSNPDEGIVPWLTNNVDVIVNANVLFALSLVNRQSADGYADAVNLIIHCIETNIWDRVSVYYPDRLMFPFYVSRAWRDAGMNDKGLENALIGMLARLINEQQDFERSNPEMKGVFPAGKDSNYVFSTTLFLIFLLNLGIKMGEEAGLKNEYLEITDNAVLFLLRNHCNAKPVNRKYAPPFFEIRPLYWESGILYSSSMQNLAVWRSNAQTTSLVLEALTKYVLEYENTQNDLFSGRLSIEIADDEKVLSLKYRESEVK